MNSEHFSDAYPMFFGNEHNLLYIRDSKFNNSWKAFMHTHSFVEIFFCIKGSGQFRFPDQILQVKEDDLIFVNPNVEHTELSAESNPLEYIVLGIDGIELHRQDELETSYLHINCREDRQSMLFYLYTILHENINKKEQFEEVCQSLLYVFLITFSRKNKLKMTLISSPNVNKDCAQVKRYIDNSFRDPITLDQLASMVHLSKYYLIHIFYKEFGVSPMNYLRQKRIEESKYLLTTTTFSISQIALMLGFSSSNYFSQIFSKFEEVSPREYRYLHKK